MNDLPNDINPGIIRTVQWLRYHGFATCDIGDVDWFACGDGNKAFGWLGGLYSVKNRQAEGSRSYEVFPDDCVRIANEPPVEAKAAVDAMLNNP